MEQVGTLVLSMIDFHLVHRGIQTYKGRLGTALLSCCTQLGLACQL